MLRTDMSVRGQLDEEERKTCLSVYELSSWTRNVYIRLGENWFPDYSTTSLAWKRFFSALPVMREAKKEILIVDDKIIPRLRSHSNGSVLPWRKAFRKCSDEWKHCFKLFMVPMRIRGGKEQQFANNNSASLILPHWPITFCKQWICWYVLAERSESTFASKRADNMRTNKHRCQQS